MALGWHFLIPVSIVNVLGVGVAIYAAPAVGMEPLDGVSADDVC